MSNSISRTFLSALAAVLLALLATAPAPAHTCTGSTLWHRYMSSSEHAEPIYARQVSMIGLWRPGTGTPHSPDLKVPTGGLAVRVNHPGDLRRIVDFERYELDGEAHFALVYSDGEAVESFMPVVAEIVLEATFEAFQDTSPATRRYLVDLETFTDDGNRLYAALFAVGDRLQDLELEIDGQAIKDRVEDDGRRMNRLVDFELITANGPGGEPSFTAVFDEGPGRQRFFPRLDADEFHDEIHLQNMAGFQIEGVETWRDQSGDTQHAALFVESDADDYLWVQACRGGLPCGSEEEVDSIGTHLMSAVSDVAENEPGLRLVDLELPLGSVGGPGDNSELGQRGSLAARTQPPVRNEFGVWTWILPTCTHAGILHDGGTNGPPYP